MDQRLNRRAPSIPVLAPMCLIALPALGLAQSPSHESAIARAYAAWVETVNAKDLEAWSSYLAPGAIFFPPDGPALSSRSAILPGVLQAALEHDLSEDGHLESAALDVEPRSTSTIPVSVAVLEKLAERVGLPVARLSEVYHCNDRPPIERRCELKGLAALISVRLESLEEDRAEVAVSSLHTWREGEVAVGGCSWSLVHQGEGWVVTGRRLCWAS